MTHWGLNRIFAGMRKKALEHLKWTTSGLVICILSSCGGSSDKDSRPVDLGSSPYAAVTGVYMDTLPCADCDGIITQVTLFADSSFALKERYLGGVAQSRKGLYGQFRFEENNSRIRLDMIHGDEKRYFRPVQNGLLALDASGKEIDNSLDYVLNLTEKASGQSGIRVASNREAGKRGVIFSVDLKGDITIDESYLKTADDNVKAIVSFYALAYNTGCKVSPCPLENALNYSFPEMKTLVTEKLGSNEQIMDAVNSQTSKEQLWLLQILNVDAKYRVMAVVSQSSDKISLTNTFELVDGKLKLIEGTKGKVSTSVASKNLNRGEEFPQGGVQVIDAKRLEKNPKGSGKK